VQLRVNPNTVARAYRELESEGLLSTRRGDGTYIDQGSRSLSVSQRLSALETEADALARRAAQLEIPLPDVLTLVEERYQEFAADPQQEPALGSKERR
jgi:GntR family transcriptional regulator